MWQIEPSPLGRIAVPPVVPDGFAVFCTTRDFEGRLTPAIADDITRMIRDRFGVSSTLATCNQVHGASAERVRHERTWRECDSCDALWSDEREVALGIKVADCLPIKMVDPTHSVVAGVHSGWRGAVQEITSRTIDAIARESAFDASSALAYLGPSIRVCCFEVGEEVAERFDERYVDRTRAKPHVDLVSYTTHVLRDRGFGEDRVFDSELCTRCEGSVFHSYRRDGSGGGRNLAIVARDR